jgi:hypothetical protein
MNLQHRGGGQCCVESRVSKTVPTAMRVRGDCDLVKGGVGASSLGGVLPGIDTQFLHARDESRSAFRGIFCLKTRIFSSFDFQHMNFAGKLV